jgi:hypothetical protein
MAIQTLTTIKNWFKTGLKPTQTQFWDTWDSFRHKNDKVPVVDIEGIDELLSSKTDKSDFKTINGESILGSGDIGIDGGGSQDLQQTLETGDIARFEGGNSRVKLLNGDPDSRTIELVTGNTSTKSSLILGNTFASLSHSEPAPGHVHSNISATNAGIILSNNDNGTNAWSNALIVPYNTTSQTTYSLPIDRPRGNYILATIDQITEGGIPNIDSVVGAGSAISGKNITFLNDPNDDRNSNIQANFSRYYNVGNSMTSLDAYGLHINNYISSGGYSGTVNILSPTNNLAPFNIDYRLPFKPDGTYTLATIDDIPTPIVPDLQNVLDVGSVATNQQISLVDFSANLQSAIGGVDGVITLDRANQAFVNMGIKVITTGEGRVPAITFASDNLGDNISHIVTENATTAGIFKLPNKGGTKSDEYTLATLDDIPLVDPLLPVSNSQSGIVNNTPLQELGGVDKIINGVRIGRGAGTTTDNLVVGDVDSMSLNTTGTYNTGIGSGSLNSNTTGTYNTGVGAYALWTNGTSNYNVAVGSSALQNLISGAGHNVAVGTGSLSTLVSGISNTGVGDFALWKATTGTFNTAVGSGSLQKVTTTIGNTAIGAGAGQNITGIYNTAIGYLSNGETGTTSTGNYNITMGYQSGRALTSGSNNILIENITNASITSGSNNIIIDSKQKSGVTTGNNNTLIGGWDGAFSPTTSDTVALGTGAGVTRFLSASTGLTTLPTQTNALISADTTGKAIVTKSYSDNMGAVVNATISALSGTALNSAYPSAIAGFRVHCLSISGGAIVYEKTTGGWIQYSTTAVTP